MFNSTKNLGQLLNNSGISLTEAQKDLLAQYAAAMERARSSEGLLKRMVARIPSYYPDENPVKKDAVTAFEDMLSAAGYGIAEAQYLLGLMYIKGVGVAPDIQQAMIWLERAASQGCEDAKQIIAALPQEFGLNF